MKITILFSQERSEILMQFLRAKKVKSYVQLKIGNTYLVSDPSSGINNQKVIFEESVERVNAKVKLGDKIFIVKKSALSNVDSEEQSVNDAILVRNISL